MLSIFFPQVALEGFHGNRNFCSRLSAPLWFLLLFLWLIKSFPILRPVKMIYIKWRRNSFSVKDWSQNSEWLPYDIPSLSQVIMQKNWDLCAKSVWSYWEEWHHTFFCMVIQISLTSCFSFSCIIRGMKRKRTYACHHRNEWVVVHSLGEACFIGPIAVRAWAWCRQWRSDQSPWPWATSSGTVSSESKPSLSSLHALYTVLLCEFAACNPHHAFMHSFITCVCFCVFV